MIVTALACNPRSTLAESGFGVPPAARSGPAYCPARQMRAARLARGGSDSPSSIRAVNRMSRMRLNDSSFNPVNFFTYAPARYCASPSTTQQSVVSAGTTTPPNHCRAMAVAICTRASSKAVLSVGSINHLAE